MTSQRLILHTPDISRDHTICSARRLCRESAGRTGFHIRFGNIDTANEQIQKDDDDIDKLAGHCLAVDEIKADGGSQGSRGDGYVLIKGSHLKGFLVSGFRLLIAISKMFIIQCPTSNVVCQHIVFSFSGHSAKSKGPKVRCSVFDVGRSFGLTADR